MTYVVVIFLLLVMVAWLQSVSADLKVSTMAYYGDHPYHITRPLLTPAWHCIAHEWQSAQMLVMLLIMAFGSKHFFGTLCYDGVSWWVWPWPEWQQCAPACHRVTERHSVECWLQFHSSEQRQRPDYNISWWVWPQSQWTGAATLTSHHDNGHSGHS